MTDDPSPVRSKPFPRNPFLPRVLRTLVPVSTAGTAFGAYLALRRPLDPRGVIDLVLALAGVGLVEWMVFKKISRSAACPDCGFDMPREGAPAAFFSCPVCRTRWTLARPTAR